MKLRILPVLAISLGASLGLSLAQPEPLRIVATTTQAHDLVQIISAGAENLQITGLMGAGVDPHLYQPTESDIVAMNEAELIIYSGLHLEGQFDAVFEAVEERGTRVYALAEPVEAQGFVVRQYDAVTQTFGAQDPHFWFDPRNWEVSALDLAEVLAALDEEQAALYRANALSYTEQLQALFTWASEGMASVPEAQRILVTSHDAFQYFGAAFGWRVAAVQGISTQDEAGVGDIRAVAETISSQSIPVIFLESSIPPNTIRAVIEAVQASGQSLRPGVRDLYSDAMGEAGTFGGTYIGMIAENVYTILQSYACSDVAVSIPAWPDALLPIPPEDLLKPDCGA